MLQRNLFSAIRRLAPLAILPLVLLPASRTVAQFSGPVDASSALSVPAASAIQPAELVKLLAAPAPQRPLVFQVGARMFFAQARIPGSIYAGPGSRPDGLQLLASKVAGVKKDQLIVLYCGCCPWQRCPNVGPAYKQLRDLGFTRVKVVYMASNFGDDWVSKGYPVERGQ